MDQKKFLDTDLLSVDSFEISLLKNNLITPEKLRHALLLKNLCGNKLEDILFKEGMVSGIDLYKALADHYNIEYVNLKKLPPPASLFEKNDFFDYIKYDFVPWKKVGNITFVAIVNLSDDLFLYLKNKYPFGFRIVYTSPEYVILSIQRRFSDLNLSIIKNELKILEKTYSSHELMSLKQKIKTLFFFLGFVSAGFYFPMFILVFISLVANIVFLSNVLFKLLLFSKGNQRTKKCYGNKYNEHELPVYTILLPLYKESAALRNLLRAIKDLNYPKSKLDVILVVEEFDRETIAGLKREKYDGLFRVVCVPKSYPKTKPKACSYALKFAKGKYLTIYDAEDRPESDQLVKAVNYFANSEEDVVCLQAKLFCINYKENLLSFLFSTEYLIWFGWLLRGLEILKIPIPLGGSSNHFKTHILKLAGGWDPYNVTEDADLGYRLAKHGYKTRILDSITWEEAPIGLTCWIKQRARWIKGHIQTYVVHLRNVSVFKDSYGIAGVLGFHAFLILPIITYFLQLLVVAQVFFPMDPLLKWFSITNLLLWVVFSMATSVFVVLKNKWQGFSCLMFLACPFYYFLHLISAIIAVSDIIFGKSHYWAKTTHNLDKRLKGKNNEMA
jgi:glycosyltransferase XagB